MKLMYSLVLCLGLSACAGHTVQNDRKIDMANPASVYCIEQGGHLDIRNTTAGQVGYCQFTDGTEIEEWSFFRESQQN